MIKQNGKRYYSLVRNGSVAEIDIYGDITSWPWDESDVSAYNLSQQLAQLEDVEEIRVNINSYGGEVAEGLAIYNALLRHPARVVTRCDGFACSIASVIFMAGDQRVMNAASLLMIHNAWTYATGNATELRKQADDLDTINGASKTAYLSRVNITEDELTELMDGETFIAPDDAVSMGFATSIESDGADKVSQSARATVFQRVKAASGEPDDEEDGDGREPETEDVPDEDPDSEQSAAASLAKLMLSFTNDR